MCWQSPHSLAVETRSLRESANWLTSRRHVSWLRPTAVLQIMQFSSEWLRARQARKCSFPAAGELRLTVRDIFLFVRLSQTLPHPPLSFRLSTSYGEMICWLPRKSFLLTNIFTPQSNALPRLFTSYTINYSQSSNPADPTFWGLIWSTIQWLSVKSAALLIIIEYSL